EELDSNNDLLLKFLQQPDSLFTKHLHNLHGAPPDSNCGHISTMKSSQDLEFESSHLGYKMEREILWKNQRKAHDNCVSHSYSKHATYNKSSEVQSQGKDESPIHPTTIVVLKPNLEKVQNATRTASSPCSSNDFHINCRNHAELSDIK